MTVPMMCLVPEVSSSCELLPSHTETTTKCMSAKLHVPKIHSGHNNYGKIYMVASDMVVLFFLENAVCHTVIFTATKRSFSLL